MKLYKKTNFFKYFISILSIAILITPVIDWFMHPELTKMEVFFNWWFMYITAIILYSIYIIIKVIKK